jgi:hypothetical protein
MGLSGILSGEGANISAPETVFIRVTAGGGSTLDAVKFE